MLLQQKKSLKWKKEEKKNLSNQNNKINIPNHRWVSGCSYLPVIWQEAAADNDDDEEEDDDEEAPQAVKHYLLLFVLFTSCVWFQAAVVMLRNSFIIPLLNRCQVMLGKEGRMWFRFLS